MCSARLPNSNSGVWTPMTTRPTGAYCRFHALMYGAVRIQLTQVYSQKSTSTTLPRRASDVSGGEFTHRSAFIDGRLLAALARQEAAMTPSQIKGRDFMTWSHIYRRDRNASRRSVVRAAGCSHAAKCPPF